MLDAPAVCDPENCADGGEIHGVGGPRQDNIPIMASVGEHMFDAEDVNRMGGQAAVYRFRESLYGGGQNMTATQYATAPAAPVSFGGSGAQVTINAPAIETQDANVYGTIIGREFARRLAG